MLSERYKNMILVLEGYGVFWLLKLTFTILAARLHFTIPLVPDITMIFISSVAACISTAFYLFFRTKLMLSFLITKDTLLYSLLGMFILWFCHIISSSIFLSNSNPVLEYIQGKNVYKYINIICFIVLGPATEEIIYRGYFVRLLLPAGRLYALYIVSGLFVTSHLLLHNYSSLEILVLGTYFFIFSMTAGFVYTQAGLVAAILVHILNNLYVLAVNT